MKTNTTKSSKKNTTKKHVRTEDQKKARRLRDQEKRERAKRIEASLKEREEYLERLRIEMNKREISAPYEVLMNMAKHNLIGVSAVMSKLASCVADITRQFVENNVTSTEYGNFLANNVPKIDSCMKFISMWSREF